MIATGMARRTVLASLAGAGILGALPASGGRASPGPSLFVHDSQLVRSRGLSRVYREQGTETLDIGAVHVDEAWEGAVARVLAIGGSVVGLTRWLSGFAFRGAALDRGLSWSTLRTAEQDGLVLWMVQPRG